MGGSHSQSGKMLTKHSVFLIKGVSWMSGLSP